MQRKVTCDIIGLKFETTFGPFENGRYNEILDLKVALGKLPANGRLQTIFPTESEGSYVKIRTFLGKERGGQ